jgi:hypothetical protein
MTQLENIFRYTSQASVLIPVVVGIRYYKVLTRPFKFLLCFFVFAMLTEIQAEVLRQLDYNNLPGLHVYTVVEFFAFSMLIYWQTQKNSLRQLIAANLLVLITIAIAIAWRQGLKDFNDPSRGYAAVSMMVYALGYLYYLFTIDDTRYMEEYPMFWICIGMLVYFAGNALQFSTKMQMIRENKDLSKGFNNVHAALNFISYCLYAQSFRCSSKQKVMA